MHEQPIAAGQPGQAQIGGHGRGHFDQTARGDEVDAVRDRHDLAFGDDHLGRVAAAGQQGDGLLTDLTAITPSPTAATTPEHSSPMMSLAPGGGG